MARRAAGLDVTRAVGVRASWAAMPSHIMAWVESVLGSPVTGFSDQVGGFSPGCAARVRCADGTRAFVKAVGAELNPDTPNLFRREILTLGLLGEHPLWAGLLASYDEGDWVGLLLEDIEGTHPDLSDDATMARLLDATDELGEVMRARVPDPPLLPHELDGGLRDMAWVYARWAESFDRLDEVPRNLLPNWVRAEAGPFQAAVLELASRPATRLGHWDIRDDNLLVRPTGEIVFFDWGAAARGQDWHDPMLARLERVHLPWFDDSLATSPALVRAGDDAVTHLLVGIGTFLAWRAVVAVDVNLPTLGEFRRAESARFLDAAARRLGL